MGIARMSRHDRGYGARMASALVVFASMLWPISASAQSDLEQAKVYFNTGVQAYEQAKYAVAIQAFDQAYRLSARPGIVFSIAQSYRKLYADQKKPQHLKRAVENYKKYLALVKEGGRRNDALDALEQLEPQLEKLGDAADTGADDVLAAPRLVVSASVKGAMISLDGAAPAVTPLDAEAKPGPHTVRITADGYFPEERDVRAPEQGMVAYDIQLREMPALLTVTANSGALISVDGRPEGIAPLTQPISMAGGTHTVSATLNGYKTFNTEVELERGQNKRIDAPLSQTRQRVISYVFFGGALTSAGIGTLFLLGTLADNARAEEINNEREGGFITKARLDEYDNAVESRDTGGVWTLIFYGSAAALAGAGFGLFFFDQPANAGFAPRPAKKSDTPAPSPPEKSPMDSMGFAPVVSPGFMGGTLVGRF